MLKLFRRNINNESDEKLVAQYQSSGNPEYLGVLYERYVELVFGVCLKFFKDAPLAEDAVMSIFETLLEKVKTQEIRQFRPWLHVVAKNHCLMQLRKKNLTVSFDEMLPSQQAEVVQLAGAVHPLDVFEENGEEQALKKCIETLSLEQKNCIRQFYFENKSYKEIAELSGEEVGMVRSYIQNGRRNLRICMEKAVPAAGRGIAEK
jgi:RNA polymerase sigma-70 factor (ECF subfamily)